MKSNLIYKDAVNKVGVKFSQKDLNSKMNTKQIYKDVCRRDGAKFVVD